MALSGRGSPLFTSCQDEELIFISYEGFLEEVELRFREQVKKNPNSVYHLRNLGKCLLAQSKYAEAEAVFRQLVEREPGSFDDWVRFGTVLAKQDKIREGIAAYTKAIDVDPHNPHVSMMIAPMIQGASMSSDFEI